MARNAAGTYTAPANSVNPAVEGTTIDEGDFNTLVDDIEAALTDSLDRTGKGKVTAHIDFDENASPGTPASGVGRLFGGSDSGLTTIFWKDSAGNTYNLLQGAASGLTYQFSTSTTTTVDPGNGVVRFNNATVSNVTEIAIDDLTASGADVSQFIVTWDDSGTTDRGRVFIQKRTAPGTIAIFRVSGALVDENGWTRLAVAYITHAGTFSANDPIAVSYGTPGAQGPTGSTGAAGANGTDPGVRWLFATSTTMADPSAGNIRLNNATLSSVTAIAVSASSGETGNPSVLAWLQALDDSTTSVRGTLIIRKASAPQNFAIYNITGLSTDNTTWLQLVVTHVSSSGSFSAADVLSVQFSRTGDAGAGTGSVTGITAGAGLSSSGVGSTGGTISVSGTLTSIEAVNAQTGTSYTIASSDHGRLVTLSNAASIAVTVPQATGSFGAGFYVDIANINAGVATLTPTTSTINGAASLILNRFLSVRLVSDGANWIALHGSSLRTQTTTVASAGTTDIGATASQRISVTGTTTITSFGTVPNQLRFVTFAGALTLTHNATTLILPGGANITTTAGDAACFSSDASGNWRCLSYQKADGTAVVGSGAASSASGVLARNVGLAVSAASSALTIALKGEDGNDPSGSNVVQIPFRSATATTGTITWRSITAATSLVVSSGSTLGVTSSTAFRVWVVAFDDAGTVRLGVILCTTYASSQVTIFPLQAMGIASSTAEGGAGAADNAQTFYTGTAVSSKSYTVLGYAEWNATGLTAGTWTTTNLSRVEVLTPQAALPSQPVQTVSCYTASGSSATTTTATNVTSTTMAITPSSPANVFRVSYSGKTNAAAGGAGVNTEAITNIARNGTAVGPINVIGVVSSSGTNMQTDGSVALDFIDFPNSATSVSYTLQHRGINTSAATGTAPIAGIVQEIMA